MAAYATPQREFSARALHVAADPARARRAAEAAHSSGCRNELTELAIVEHLVDRLAEKVAAVIAERLNEADERSDDWFDSRNAAEYLGIHRDTLRKLAAERAIPTEQDGPGCKLYFRRSDLDAWRRSGGRPRHLMSSLDLAA
jgi:excisionase family DNA binding protein